MEDAIHVPVSGDLLDRVPDVQVARGAEVGGVAGGLLGDGPYQI
jgi:hypothetical protein